MGKDLPGKFTQIGFYKENLRQALLLLWGSSLDSNLRLYFYRIA